MRSNFAATPLGSIAHIEMGQSPDSSTVREGNHGGVPFLQGNAEFGVAHPTPRFSCVAPMKMCRAGDILISVRAPVGAMNIADRDYCIGRGLAAVRVPGMSPTFAAHMVSAAAPALRRVAQGTTFEAVNKTDLASLVVMTPPQADREPLGFVLDTLDTTIRQTEAIIEKLKQVKLGLLHDLLTRGIDANGELRPPQSQAPHLYKDSPLGWIPREWHTFRIKEICALGRGRVISQVDLAKSPGPYPVYSSQTKNEGIFGHLATYDFDGPHVTWTTDGANAGTVFYRDGRFNCTNVCGTLAALADDTDLRYLALALSRETSRFVSRVGNDKLMNGVVAEIQVPVPPPGEQLSIADATAPVEVRMRGEEEVVEKQALLKAGLMDDLLTGRVRVTPLLT